MGQYARSDIVLESNSLLRAVFFIPKNKERQVTVMRQAVTTVQYVFAGIGGFMGWFLGGLDGFLYALLMFVVIDYVTGLMAAFVQKKVSSEVGFKGMAEYDEVVYQTNVANGYLVPCTQLLESPSALLEDSRFRDLLNTLAENYRFVIIDTPPLGSVSDSALIASMCDGAVLVIRAGVTSKGMIKQSLFELEQVNCKLLGTVLNRAEVHSRAYGKYYSKYYGKYGKKYGYGYGYGKEEKPDAGK